MTTSAIPAPRFPGAAALATAVWLALAVAAGATGFLIGLPFPGPQIIILSLAVLTLAAAIVPSRFRDWIDGVPLRTLVAVNATRFIGAAFLVVAAQGQLNPVFANRAGWGDIAVALSLVPTFFVPLLLANHVLIFRRLISVR
jgi:hypothetical protein